MDRVKDVMTREVIHVGLEHTLSEAYGIMREFSIRHLPVVGNGKLLGIVSEGDVLLRSTMQEAGIHVPHAAVEEIMSRDIVTCSPQMPASHAAATMMTCKIDCLPVVQGEVLLGIVTTTDLLDLLCRNDEVNGKAVMPFQYSEPNAKPLVNVNVT